MKKSTYIHFDNILFLLKINISKGAFPESCKQDKSTAVICLLLFLGIDFLNPNLKKRKHKQTSKTITLGFNYMPDLLYKCFVPFMQGTIKFPEVIWSLRPGITAWPSVHLFRLIYQPSHSSLPSSPANPGDTERAVTQATDQSTVTRIKAEEVKFGTFFPSDLYRYFMLCRCIKLLVSAVI